MTFKHIILLELALLFLATTFKMDSSGGWVQQTLPVNNQINDIYFLDSLNGWVCTQASLADTLGDVLHTTNGGTNWLIQFQVRANLYGIQFVDANTGYVVGSTGNGEVYKTTNSGTNWSLILNAGSFMKDLFFVNKDTGWVCDDDAIFGAGVLKTTNGGINWQQQLDRTYKPMKLFFINRDTGWVTGQASKLYKTTNGGTNWNLLYSFPGNLGTALFFLNNDTGFVSGGGSNTILKTTNAGLNWNPTSNGQGGKCMFFINNSTGWLCDLQNIIQKTTDGGLTWFSQTSPLFNNASIMFTDSLKGWDGGNGMLHTTDGGGPPVGIHPIDGEVPSEYRLYQNYPNPFNPNTIIRYSLPNPSEGGAKFVKMIIYDITGKVVEVLVNQNQRAGTYQTDFSGNNYSSGVYFYSLIADGKVIDTKKMLMIK